MVTSGKLVASLPKFYHLDVVTVEWVGEDRKCVWFRSPGKEPIYTMGLLIVSHLVYISYE